MSVYNLFKYSICFVFIWITLTLKSYAQSYGLGFYSHEVVQDKRTSLDLSPDKTLCFKDDFNITFDLSFLPNRATYFGYIIRIIENDKRNIDLVYDNENNVFKVIIGEKASKIVFNIDKNKLFDSWNTLKINFDLDNDKLVFFVGHNSYAEKALHLQKGSCYKILLGANNYKQFQTTDVPPMKIRDIRITEKNALVYDWPLNEKNGLIGHEVISQNDAAVGYPLWITAMHYNWQKAQNLKVNGAASIAFNAQRGEVYILGSDSLYTYDINTYVLKSNGAGIKNLNIGNQLLFNNYDGKLYDIYADQQFVSGYDLSSQKWDKRSVFAPVTSFWQLNKFFSNADSSLYAIGGYGHLVYKNTIQQYNLKTHNWQFITPKGDFFTPRYLAALGASAKGDTAYILGGYGSTTGQQILNPRNLYDLMRFTVKDKTFKKMFELSVKGDDFAFANSLIIDKEHNSYYGLVFPKHKYNSSLQLINGSLIAPSYKLTGDTIPYLFHDTKSFADLYYSRASQKFVAVTSLRLDNNQTVVSIFTLLSPPYGEKYAITALQTSYNYWFLLIAIALFALIVGFIGWYFKNKSKQRSRTTIPGTNPVAPVKIEPGELKPVNEPVTTEIKQYNTNTFKNTILLFGDLQVFDADGIDITKFFTPLIKELFLVILLYSVRWGRGVSSEKLNEILWFDKDVKSARNNRSVNIAKLKSLLEKMEHCQLSKDTGYWKLDIDFASIYVDYYHYLNIIKDKKGLNRQKVQNLSEITQRGNFLSNIEYEWLDSFKSEISNEVIDTYIHFAGTMDTTKDPEFMVELANFIFYFDPVNEEAMVLKCKTLSLLGKHSLAKNTFENFVKEYKIIYGEDFKKDFHTILE